MKSTAIGAWADVSLQELFFAYRKAKADCFFERSICISRQFAEFEEGLAPSLLKMLERIRSGEIDGLLAEHLGRRKVVAKKLGVNAGPQSESSAQGHGFFSDPARAFARLASTHTLTPEFRIVGEFPVEMHVLSALWINLVGHKFDGQLGASAYGSRLRRYRPDAGMPPGTVGDYHLEAIGSFQPYFSPYKNWRNSGLRAIRRELVASQPVIAVTMDLTSYYHRVDPAFLSNVAFHEDIGVTLTDWERDFTRAFVQALANWSNLTAAELLALGCNARNELLGGLPIGLSLVRIAANVLLVGLDRDIEQGLAPVYYGRYVDDIFLVLRDPGNVSDPSALLQFLSARTRYFPPKVEANGEVFLKLPASYSGKTTLLLQQGKQKVFYLQGQGGLDLLDNIESQIRSVSSERRLMPSPDRLESMASAQVLTAAGHPAEEADTLRRADGLSVRRLGWSIQLRAVETLARDLRSDDWKIEREQFYQFAHNHILRPDKILDHIDYLPRLLSLAVALTDWTAARRLVDGALDAVSVLQNRTELAPIKLNGCEAHSLSGSRAVWSRFKESVKQAAADAIARSVRWSARLGEIRPLPEAAIELCELVGLERDREAVRRLALILRESDWAKTPYKDHLRRDARRQRPAASSEQLLHSIYPHEDDLRRFLRRSSAPPSTGGASRVGPHCSTVPTDERAISVYPYLFPTRPYTTQEVSLFLPGECIFGSSPKEAARSWARYVRAVRGVWVWAMLVTDQDETSQDSEQDSLPTSSDAAIINRRHSDGKIRLGMSSLLTTKQSFEEGANGKPDISRARYQRLETIINQAIHAKPRPTHLLLPELSLPERWLGTVSALLRDSGIGLIAGLDYSVKGQLIHSEAVLVLTDERLGFPSTVQIRQPKALPAAGEEEALLHVFGKTWAPDLAGMKKPVYAHGGFCFGVLVCSELQNMDHRLRFQGHVDCLIVLSWNQDLETFSSLVESASLDVHAHIALVNNRKYGDSRVRSPAKAHHARDLCRLRGGENEHVVVVELDVAGLRAFQSRAKRWPLPDDPYKPVPEGFVMQKWRRSVPR